MKEPPEDHRPNDINLGFQVLKKVKKNYLLFKPPSVWYFVMATWANIYKILLNVHFNFYLLIHGHASCILLADLETSYGTSYRPSTKKENTAFSVLHLWVGTVFTYT